LYETVLKLVIKYFGGELVQEKPIFIDSISHEIKAINQIMQRKMLSSAADEGIDKVTVMHGWIIGYLYNRQGTDVFQKDIENEFAISRSTVTNILKLMEKKGYIERVSVESDARLKKLVLTEKGCKMHAVIHSTIEENESRFNSALTPEERKTFLYLIKKLRSGLESN
jgi:DNA-binding MarR family transcriptional regulator